MTSVKEIKIEQLSGMREISQAVSQQLHQILVYHLKTLAPLFSPRKVLGEFMESAYKDKVPGADKIFVQFEARYKDLCQSPFDIPTKLSTPIPSIQNNLTVYPWCYPHTIGNDFVLSVRSPVRWILAYAASYDLARLLQDRLDGSKPRYEDIKTLLVNSLTIATLIEISAGLKGLVEGLKFELSIEQSDIAGALPFVVIAAPINSFRPQDDLMKMVAQLSGRAVFEELVDIDAIMGLEHPFKQRLRPLLK
jgi:hypothetical protein